MEKHLFKNRLPLILAAFFLTIVVCLYAPISMYALNKEEFWFNLRIFWYVPTFFFILSFILATGVGLVLKGKISDFYLALVFGFGLCFYLQGNFLGLKLGSLNGSAIEWDRYRMKMIVNLCIWCILLFTIIVLMLWKTSIMKKIVMYLSAFLGAVQFISLVMLLVPLIQNGDFSTSYVSTMTEEGLFEVGDRENIIVFILDTYDEKMFNYVQEVAPEVIEDLDGFTYYDNFTSTFTCTTYSLTCLMSGSIFRNEMPRYDWIEEKAKQRLYFDELTDHGYEISLYTDMINEISQRVKGLTNNYTEAPMRISDKKEFAILLYRMVACQYFPDIVKPRAWMSGKKFASTRALDYEYPFFDESNGRFKARINENGLTVKNGIKAYKLIHLYGPHEPYYIDEYGNEAPENWNWQTPALGCMRIMTDYISKLKETGMYDQTTMIIMADHGYGGGGGVFGNPIFLMKEKNTRGELKTCSFEAGLENFGATIADLCGTENTAPYGRSILDATEDTCFDRYYYQFVMDGVHGAWLHEGQNHYLVEYLTDPKSNDTSLFKNMDREYLPSGEVIPHIQYCECCQKPHEGTEVVEGRWDFHEHIHTSEYPY